MESAREEEVRNVKDNLFLLGIVTGTMATGLVGFGLALIFGVMV